MPEAVRSAQQAYELLRRSEILPPARLSALVPDATQLPDTPLQFLDGLVARGALTRFQADQLLKGRHKGFRLGAYVLQAPLGRGGMGAVYLAEHQELHRKVAVKVLIPPRDADQRLAVERFLREARAVAALDHPNIVRVFDVSSTGAVPFLVMEFVDGRTLQQALDRDGPLPLGAAAEFVAQAAAGLQHAHEKGFVHRDIKPGNLMADRDGVVKVLDLGLARAAGNPDDRLTEQLDRGAVVGTADYISPEQAINSSDVDVRADIYSLGATFFALVVGRAPFEGTTVQKLMQHQAAPAPDLAALVPEAPPGLVAVVAKMMAKRPADRYQTPAEVVAALLPWVENPHRVVAGMALTAAGSSGSLPRPAERTAPRARADRETGRLTAEATVPDEPRPKKRRKKAEAPRRSNAVLFAAVGGVAVVALVVAGVVWAVSGRGPAPVARNPEPAPNAPAPNAPEPTPKPPDRVISPAEAATKVGERVTVQYAVASTGGQSNLYLNSNADFKAKDNFAVMLSPRVRTGKWDQATGDTFMGKTIRATGFVKLNREAPTLEVTDPAQLEIVNE